MRYLARATLIRLTPIRSIQDIYLSSLSCTGQQHIYIYVSRKTVRMRARKGCPVLTISFCRGQCTHDVQSDSATKMCRLPELLRGLHDVHNNSIDTTPQMKKVKRKNKPERCDHNRTIYKDKKHVVFPSFLFLDHLVSGTPSLPLLPSACPGGLRGDLEKQMIPK